MRTFKTVTVPATPETTKQVEDKVICDLCHREAPGRGIRSAWGKDSYDATDVDVSLKTGNSYPECGDTHTISFDVCPECFTDKLIPWMASQGATPQTEDVDW